MNAKKKAVQVLLSNDCYEKVKTLAQENAYSLSGYIRQLIHVHLRELEQNKKRERF